MMMMMMVYCVPESFRSNPLFSEGFGSVNPCKRCWRPQTTAMFNSEEYLPSDEEESSDEELNTRPSLKKSKEADHPPVMPTWSTMTAVGIFDALALYRLPKGKPKWVSDFKPAWGNVSNRVIKAMALPESFGKVIASTVKERTLQRNIFVEFDKPENVSKLLALRKAIEKETTPVQAASPLVVRDDADNLICRLAMMCVDPRCQQILGIIYTGPGEDNGR